MGDFIDKADVESRMSAARIRRALDDDNDGTADTPVLNQLIQDAESKFRGWIGPVYVQSVVKDSQPTEAKRLCLDIFMALVAQRHPEVYRADWEAMMKGAERDLQQLRKGMTNMGVDGAPKPAANQRSRWRAAR